jgi:hypothetical protein
VERAIETISLNMIGKNHTFRFGRWFAFSILLDAAILLFKRAFLPAMCTDMKIYTGTFRGVPFCYG